MKRAIVTGATGLVGVHLVEELLRCGIEVIAVCKEGSENISRLPNGVTTVYCDMDNYGSLAKKIPTDWADVFYHLAWENVFGKGRADASLQALNAACTLNALRAARAVGCAKFVAAGTVYENFSKQIAAALEFRNSAFYILSKKYARDMSGQLALQLGIDFTWCTFCQPVGKYINSDQLLAYAVRSLVNGEPPAFGTADEWFDVIDVRDLATGLYLAGKQKLTNKEYFIGSSSPRKLKDYLTELPGILGVETSVLLNQRPDDGMRFEKDWFDCSPFTSETGYSPNFNFNQSVLYLKEYLPKGCNQPLL